MVKTKGINSKKTTTQDEAVIPYLVRLPESMHEELRLIAFEKKTDMSILAREGIELIIKKYKKKYS